MNNLVTFCFDSICYSGMFSPNHPKIPPGIVYGLANGVAENLPLVLYSPHNHTNSKSFLYWILHYTSISGILLFGASVFQCLFLADNWKDTMQNEKEDAAKTIDYSKKYFDKYDVLKSLHDPAHDEENTDNSANRSHLNQVIDYTGQYGNVLMYYNPESDSFAYLADNKNIPFTYLETVSRKLGISFHCISNIIDRRNVQNKKFSLEKEVKYIENLI